MCWLRRSATLAPRLPVSLTHELTPAAILNDQLYIAALARRFGGVDVDALRRRNLERTLYTPADRAEARKFAPGVEYVGIYAGKPGGDPVLEVDFSNGRLSARLGGSQEWTPLIVTAGPMRYELVTPSATIVLDFEVVGRSVDRVTLDPGGAAPKRVLVRIS